MLKSVVVAAIALLTPQVLLAYTPAEERAAKAICVQASKNINTLADFTRTDCTPAKDGDALSLIFVSLDLVFASERYKKAYLVVFVGAVGAALNANPKTKIVNASFMDKHLGRQKLYFTISSKDAARLQREIKADRISLDDFYSGILAAGKLRPVGK